MLRGCLHSWAGSTADHLGKSLLHVAARWGNSTAVASRWREQNCETLKILQFLKFSKGYSDVLQFRKALFFFPLAGVENKRHVVGNLCLALNCCCISVCFALLLLPMFRMRTTYFGVSLNFLVHVSLFWIRFLNAHMQTQTTIYIHAWPPHAIKEKKPPLSLRRTCCWQTTPPQNHNLWLVLWGRMEKCNQVQNADTSFWGERHPISKQPLKGPYGISCLIWSNKKQENPTVNTCRVLLLPVSLGQCLSLSRCCLLDMIASCRDVQHA